ncbi:hypothetical protein D8B26_000034 [Coccidioides posadasii str. Silveira]|uniref:Uncharacterized protein n=3 Tax=Coccidioides posadasii TaxID=199306 RepID=E9D7D8_COCPS|nr:hypothetical protein CPC735_067440 [Coccidioides posadasii C735 delta SOWgp]EER25645.1 hypothetical protein CPC735_067440 [Coccidioides posadasii C735 delta SOWgp]EFW17296.1 conserved hypothetical protein [Coccidioides posadasii str. Silveira]KMM71062.1 hypothetical protein CPAG_07369 [Coccidioides posadasii RMSCC 3488]QVM05325.1 hypothetical protein D8B26_000034 [Coccidioides posadasii str. Silveira]|eukprot:XP_003067790.1 hypothetical protein CPC735_067440 [Coccidioides posadasii C735 delta SOWgp]
MANNDPPVGFHLISTLCYDPALATLRSSHNSAYYLLPYHYDRLLSAATDFQWTKAVSRLRECGHGGLLKLFDQKIPSQSQRWRMRILLDQEGDIKAEFTPLTAPLPGALFLPALDGPSHPFSSAPSYPSWVLRLDSQPTQPSPFTRHKTTQRELYDAARKRAGIKSPQQTVEVLLYSPSGEVMEGSITTPYFRRSRIHSGRGGHGQELEEVWVTPPLSSGGNAGTTRRYALEEGLCVEEVVGVDDLVDGEEVWLSNGVRGFIRAVLELG